MKPGPEHYTDFITALWHNTKCLQNGHKRSHEMDRMPEQSSQKILIKEDYSHYNNNKLLTPGISAYPG